MNYEIESVERVLRERWERFLLERWRLSALDNFYRIETQTDGHFDSLSFWQRRKIELFLTRAHWQRTFPWYNLCSLSFQMPNRTCIPRPEVGSICWHWSWDICGGRRRRKYQHLYIFPAPSRNSVDRSWKINIILFINLVIYPLFVRPEFLKTWDS